MVQVFLPYQSAAKSLEAMDLIRLGKQREEILVMLEAITNPAARQYQYHPTVRMWRPFASTLCLIGMMNCREWVRRGRVDTALPSFYEYMDDPGVGEAWVTPPWFEDNDFHRSHRSRLVMKKPAHYGPKFPHHPRNMPYLYPRLDPTDGRGYRLFLSVTDLERIKLKTRQLPLHYQVNATTLEVVT